MGCAGPDLRDTGAIVNKANNRNGSVRISRLATQHVQRRAALVDSQVPPRLRLAAGWAWRVLVLLVPLYLILTVLVKLKLAVVAIFVALVLTAVLRPLVELLN